MAIVDQIDMGGQLVFDKFAEATAQIAARNDGKGEAG